MVGPKLPDVPDPTKIAQSGAEAVKAVAQGAVGAGFDVAAGVEQILFNTIEGSIRALAGGATEIVSMVKGDVNAGKTTIEKVRSDIDQAGNRVLSQVDQAIGQEIVRKFKSEVERQLRF